MSDQYKQEINKLKKVKQYFTISYFLALPGFIMQMVSLAFDNPIIGLIGTVMFFLGLIFYIKAKGRSYFWVFIGVFGIFGLLALMALKNKNLETEQSAAT